MECRAKYRPKETLTGKCQKCGKTFTFPSDARHWPRYCPECRARRKRR
jgi:predicted Zn-ribbon and HTH transcriptional regulator